VAVLEWVADTFPPSG